MNKLFKVHEWSAGYEVKHIPSGKTHWMGDGVDYANALAFFVGAGFPEPPEIGTEEFRELWEIDLNNDPEATLEACFPEEVK